MLGTFLEHFTMLLLNSDNKVPSNPTLISTTHMFALALMMPTIFLNFLETATPLNKPFSVTALKLQAMLFLLDLNELKKNYINKQKEN